MELRTIIKDSAQVVRISNVGPGDVYKRLVPKGYANPPTEFEMRYGWATDVMNNGEVVVLSALEYEIDYSSAKLVQVTHRGDMDLALFPATPEEFALHRDEVMTHLRRAVQQAEQALDSAEGKLRDASRMFEAIEKDASKAAALEAGQEQ